MRTILILILLLHFGSARTQGQNGRAGFDKRSFYHDLSSDDIQAMNRQLDILSAANFAGKDAFEGALMMKKAGSEKEARKRMDGFKTGRHKLEHEIARDTANAEFRFLRLVIQEHLPKGIPYRADMDRDASLLIRKMNSLPEETRDAVQHYARSSARLKTVTE
jgi:hypothetical protein